MIEFGPFLYNLYKIVPDWPKLLSEQIANQISNVYTFSKQKSFVVQVDERNSKKNSVLAYDLRGRGTILKNLMWNILVKMSPNLTFSGGVYFISPKEIKIRFWPIVCVLCNIRAFEFCVRRWFTINYLIQTIGSHFILLLSNEQI